MKNLNRPTALIIGAVALLVGAVGPWITFLGLISAGPTTFTEVWTVVFAGIAVVVASALTGRHMRAVSIVVGLLVVAEVCYVWFHLAMQGSSNSDIIKVTIQPGWGLYLSTLAALFLIASTFVAKKDVQIKPLVAVG